MDFIGPFPEVQGYNYQEYGDRLIADLLAGDRTITWPAGVNSLRSGLEVHVNVVATITSSAGSKTINVDVVSSSNRWGDRTGKQIHWPNLPGCDKTRSTRLVD